MPDGQWELQVQLKLRDPADDWQSWQYVGDGGSIARVWVPAYDPAADSSSGSGPALTPLVELSEELAGVRERIGQTDTLID